MVYFNFQIKYKIYKILLLLDEHGGFFDHVSPVIKIIIKSLINILLLFILNSQ